MKNNILDLQQTLGYTFKNPDVLITALTHQSYANEYGVPSYERLEFLGDAVIEVVVSDYIYSQYLFDAGLSTKLRAKLVSTQYLSGVAEKLNVKDMVLKAKSLQTISLKNTADLVESIVGAVYEDGGLSEAKKIIDRFIIISPENVNNVLQNLEDYKSKFQELMQSKGRAFEYRVLSSSGLDHSKTFVVGLFLDGTQIISASGSSIHGAEEECAKEYFSKFSK